MTYFFRLIFDYHESEFNKRGKYYVFLINQKDELAKEANDEEAEFFRKHLVKD
ncbi:hypothetical protein FD18_GL000175 [Lactobacillus taiwanensis DSM 21401]|nr:hypothetical protein FD18_GL000175 [Lactobacillus taiwanensis DSM 21401]